MTKVSTAAETCIAGDLERDAAVKVGRGETLACKIQIQGREYGASGIWTIVDSDEILAEAFHFTRREVDGHDGAVPWVVWAVAENAVVPDVVTMLVAALNRST